MNILLFLFCLTAPSIICGYSELEPRIRALPAPKPIPAPGCPFCGFGYYLLNSPPESRIRYDFPIQFHSVDPPQPVFRPQKFPDDPEVEKIWSCAARTQSNSSAFNYLGPYLFSTSSDPEDLVLCPGDAFGDLNDTYIVMRNCSLAMYHREKMIWSSKLTFYDRRFSEAQFAKDHCALFVKRDGNIILYQQGYLCLYPVGGRFTANILWDSQTNFNPIQTEVRLQDQQVQIVQTFEDGAQRLFYANENNPRFFEDLGTPIKVADKFIIKNHSDEDRTILRKNEYIGDLNGTHLILQTNCDLQLRNKDKMIWSFSTPFKLGVNCVLNIQDTDEIAISTDSQNGERYDLMIISYFPRSLKVLQSKITFEENQPIIIQTLNNGSEITLSSGSGIDSAFKPRKEARKIAENFITVSEGLRNKFIIQRMDYIGDLTGLHLILEQNCSLILANGREKLWEFNSNSPKVDRPIMECSVTIDYNEIFFKKEYVGIGENNERIFPSEFSYWDNRITGVQTKLESNKLVVICERLDKKSTEIYHAGSITHGTLLHLIPDSSYTIYSNDFTLPKMSYIGDLQGIFLVLEDRCKWILYNKTEVIWESGGETSDRWNYQLVMRQDGGIVCIDEMHQEDWLIWSVHKDPVDIKASQKAVKTELLVDQSGLRMVLISQDGIESEYKAIKGTSSFFLLSTKKASISLNSDL